MMLSPEGERDDLLYSPLEMLEMELNAGVRHRPSMLARHFAELLTAPLGAWRFQLEMSHDQVGLTYKVIASHALRYFTMDPDLGLDTLVEICWHVHGAVEAQDTAIVEHWIASIVEALNAVAPWTAEGEPADVFRFNAFNRDDDFEIDQSSEEERLRRLIDRHRLLAAEATSAERDLLERAIERSERWVRLIN